MQYSWLFSNKTFALVKGLFVCLFCGLCVSYLSSGGEKEDYKCELIGGDSPRHSNTSSIIAHYTYITTCCILLLLLTVSMYTMLLKISEHTISC